MLVTNIVYCIKQWKSGNQIVKSIIIKSITVILKNVNQKPIDTAGLLFLAYVFEKPSLMKNLKNEDNPYLWRNEKPSIIILIVYMKNLQSIYFTLAALFLVKIVCFSYIRHSIFYVLLAFTQNLKNKIN